jgi:hypothetical protein
VLTYSQYELVSGFVAHAEYEDEYEYEYEYEYESQEMSDLEYELAPHTLVSSAQQKRPST